MLFEFALVIPFITGSEHWDDCLTWKTWEAQETRGEIYEL